MLVQFSNDVLVNDVVMLIHVPSGISSCVNVNSSVAIQPKSSDLFQSLTCCFTTGNSALVSILLQFSFQSFNLHDHCGAALIRMQCLPITTVATRANRLLS